jgi:hypothetical protein
VSYRHKFRDYHREATSPLFPKAKVEAEHAQAIAPLMSVLEAGAVAHPRTTANKPTMLHRMYEVLIAAAERPCGMTDASYTGLVCEVRRYS